MAGWILTRRDGGTSDGSVHTAYSLYAYRSPGDAEPSKAWFIERVQTTASFLAAASTTRDYASYAENGSEDSETAWSLRQTLTYSQDNIPADYAGDPSLNPIVQTSGGGGMDAIKGLHSTLSVQESDGWVDLSSDMVEGSYYQILPQAPATARVLSSTDRPTNDGDGIEVGQGARQRDDVGNKWTYTGKPIWLRTSSLQAIEVKIVERG